MSSQITHTHTIIKIHPLAHILTPEPKFSVLFTVYNYIRTLLLYALFNIYYLQHF